MKLIPALLIVGMLAVSGWAREYKNLPNPSEVVKKAESGDVNAQEVLRNAMEWFTKSAEQGDAIPQYYLGVYLFNGTGVGSDEREAEALKWFTKAAEQGHAVAQVFLGVAYYKGNGVDRDKKEAVKWFTKSAEQGDAEAQGWLARCYKKGMGVEKDEKEAVKWDTRRAEQGDITSFQREGEAKKAERLNGCLFKETAYFDGDSFSVLTASGDEKTCRLYAVDTCDPTPSSPWPDELEIKEIAEQVNKHALYFGITSEQAVELGKNAKDFTENLLKNKKFSFVTKWNKALGRSKSTRFLGEIIVDGDSLACLLVKNGLARIHGIIPAEDRAFILTRAKLKELEAEAKEAGAGGWGMAKK